MLLNRQEDLHIHCNYNDHSDSDLTASNIIKEAEQKKLERIAITEHVRKSSEWTRKYINEINSQASRTKINILRGFEAKILENGEIDCPKEYLSADYFIIASFHTKYTKEQWYAALLEAIKNPYVNVIGHLAPESSFVLSDAEIEEVGSLLVSMGKIIELNAKYARPPPQFLKIFKRQGVRFHLGSDAHSLKEIGDFDRINHLINLIEK
jgi:putative hydrolase